MRKNYHRILECPLNPAEQGPEFELLLTCCRPEPNEAHFLRQKQLALSSLDISKVLELGNRHSVSSLLHYNLSRHPPGTFPDELLEKLADKHKRNTHHTSQALRAMHELMLSDKDLKLIAMKGLDVAARAYGDLAARDVGDIDILVDPKQLDATLTKLKELGWNLAQPEIMHSASRKMLLRNLHHCILVRKKFPQIELHWRAMQNPFAFPIEDWKTLSVSERSNIGIPGLNNEDLVIFLCLHGNDHGWACLKWLFDLPNVLDTHALNWPQLWQRGHQLGAGLAIQQGLLLAQQYCNMDLSAEIQNGFRYRIKPSQWRAISVFQQGPKLWLEHPPAFLKLHQWINCILTARKVNVLLWQFAMIFYPNVEDYRQIRLPSWLHLLYFPLRPVLWGIRQVKIRQMRNQKANNRH